jgi:hypothetical protein
MPCCGCDNTGHNIKNCPEKPCAECNSTEHVKKDCLHYKEHRRKRNRVENMTDWSIFLQHERNERKLKPVDELVVEKCEKLNKLKWNKERNIVSEVVCVKEIIYRPEIDMSFDVPRKYCFSCQCTNGKHIHMIWRGDEEIHLGRDSIQTWYIVENKNQVTLLEGQSIRIRDDINRPKLMVTIVWSDNENVPWFIQQFMESKRRFVFGRLTGGTKLAHLEEDAITYFREHGSLKGYRVESLEQEARNRRLEWHYHLQVPAK